MPRDLFGIATAEMRHYTEPEPPLCPECEHDLDGHAETDAGWACATLTYREGRNPTYCRCVLDRLPGDDPDAYYDQTRDEAIADERCA